VGPYAYLKTGDSLGRGLEGGAYCELKNTRSGRGASAAPLLCRGRGDRRGGEPRGGYDHGELRRKDKYRTTIGDGVFTGINTNLIAPITIGENAYLGAGSVVNKDIPPGKWRSECRRA
jgi:bifunctional UDP-N-acetylglucosamine pyrophosphorylase/glucosamine-1-phosphate N-acetyltransferase